MYRVGGLLLGIADADSFRTELSEELHKFGYVEGHNLLFEFRSAEEKLDLLPKLAAELVALKVDVIGRSTRPVHSQRNRRRVRFR